MSMNTPPPQPQLHPLPQPAPPLTLKARLMREAGHWSELPWRRFVGLLLPICLLVFLDPPLPVVAYGLWLWASSSWDWRDRWSSIRALARRGGVIVSVVLLVAALSSAQVWIFPDLVGALQAFWSAHLPGELSLIPLFKTSLLARILLLLPLAPALTLYFERVDPRTRVQEQRILTARDMQPKPPKAKPDMPPAPQEPARAAQPKPKPIAKAAPREPAKEPGKRSPEQITIEGFLASDPARPASPSRQATKKPSEPAPKAETPAPEPLKKGIDWNDVAE
jgi:hypothetical protein